MRFWHIAHPSWKPGEDLRPREELLDDGINIPWLWDEAPEGTDGDRVCLFPDDEKGHQLASWMAEDRPDYHIIRVDLPEDLEEEGMFLISASWEPFPAIYGRIPARYLTKVEAIGE